MLSSLFDSTTQRLYTGTRHCWLCDRVNVVVTSEVKVGSSSAMRAMVFVCGH